MVFCLPLDRFTCCVYVTITDVNNLFPDFRSIYYFPLTSRQLRFSGIHYKQSACLLFNKIIRFQQKISKRCRLENWAFCIRYFSRTKSTPAKKNSEQCFSGTTKPTCQNSVFLNTFKMAKKSRGLSCTRPFNCSHGCLPNSRFRQLFFVLLWELAHIYFTQRNLLLNSKQQKKMIGHHTRLWETDDLPLWRSPAIKKKPPFFNAHALIMP